MKKKRTMLMGLGALTETEIQDLGKNLAQQSHTFAYSANDLAAVLSQYDKDTRERIVAIYTANNGDSAVLQRAIMYTAWDANKGKITVLGVLSTVSAAVCGYHGYKRNNSLGWGIGWFILGGMLPVLAPTVAIAQGLGKPKR